MIYLDTSVVLAHLFAEDRRPPDALWARPLVASRLLEYEVWTRVNARELGNEHGEAVRAVVGRVALLGLIPEILGRAREPFPIPVRTLDALHLASMDFLRSQGQAVEVASYDARMLEGARALGFDLYPLD